MYIEAIILEGFKSYSNRVYVGPLHPQFNAVTGLNGTGKSNILDAICFVLGITNHSLVRATKLDDLVYKQGQAGVTRATVTLKFRNDDLPLDSHSNLSSSTTTGNYKPRTFLPYPYSEMPDITITRQIVIGGRDRYLLNSRNAQAKEVRDFFHCAQMNINNPHFMIQQGKITKVINMRPKDLLGLIEEVSGTRMYEMKRANAVKLIQKKEKKLQDIAVVLEEEIHPTIERLRKEKLEYFNFVSLKEEMQRFQRFDVAYRFYCAQQLLQQGTSDLDDLLRKKTETEAEISKIDGEMRDLQKYIDQINAERQQMDVPLQAVRKKKDEIEKTLAKRQSDEKSARRELKQAADALEDLKKEEKKLSKKLQEKKQSRSLESQQVEAAEKTLNEAKEKLTHAERKLDQLYASGGSGEQGAGRGGEGEGDSLHAQLKRKKTRLAELEAEEFNLNTEIKHLDAELTTIKATAEKYDKENIEMTKQKEEVSSRVKSLETDLSQHAVDEEKLQRLREERKSCQRELEAANQEAQSSLQELNSWEKIHVNLPRGLPVEKYHGQVFELIELKLDYLDFAKALQLSVGGKLEYVVVEDKDASKAIFKYNNFANSRRRVTLLPIRDCQVGRTCDTQSLVQNRRFVGLEPEDSSVMRCLDLVEYDGRRHEKLAQYVFGGSLVCANADIAQKITYQSNRRLAFPSVTVEGDVFQTGGVMSGGASKHHRQTLLLWKNFKRCSQLAGDLQERLKQIDFYLLPMEELGQKHARITRDLRLALNELQNLESAFAASTAGSERRRIGEMEERKEECARRLETLHTEKTSILEEIRKLEKEVYELHHHRDKLEGSLKKEVKELRQKVKSLEAKAATLQLETAQFRQELGVLEKEVLSVQQDIETRTKHLQDLENSIQDRITLVEEQKALVESVRKEIEKCLAEAAVSDKRHGDIASKLKKLQKQKEHYTLSLKKYQHSMDDREKNIQAARREMEVLQRGNEWLEVEALKFNQPGSPFDFRQLRPETARQRLQQLKAEVQKLQSSVNSSAATLLERTEKDLEELLERKQQVEHDKAKIEAVISELDVKKRQSLNNTWKQVNTNFTDIFENLLPNAQAKLDQVNSKNLMDGLEMKIAFNHKWKDSLAELSGGQRSLLALSLILALLKVKPAPVYILDEVDAALDLSHTQNIGSMIKTQFPTSQFIIVSLKEGMFSYADVLFRTRLIDGVSSVERHALAERPQNPRRGSYSGRGESRSSSSSSPLTASRKRMKKQTQLQHSHVEETPYS